MEVLILLIAGLIVADSNGAFENKALERPPIVEVYTGPHYIIEPLPIFKKNHYYKAEQKGYYITDLSSQPDSN